MISECNICYNERPKDMMVKCCNKHNTKVCDCNVSICRRCADSMELKCPTCRTKCNKFTYADEALDKIQKPKTQRPRPDFSRFTLGQDILVYGTDGDLWIRKAKIVKINSASISVKLYNYTTTQTPIDTYNVKMTYRWTNTLQWNTICIKSSRRIKEDVNRSYFECVETEYCLIR